MSDTDLGTNQSSVRTVSSTITWANHWDHLLARWSFRRNEHRVEPGLYALGQPTPDSLVFVTANYTLSFDALRSALGAADAYILVLDTQGINVWCAAGKGTFGTDELVHRIEATGLSRIVRHRVLILPQLGAAGIAAHEVKRRSGFRVEYGPVRAGDITEYLETRGATPEMRRVRFTFADRLVLIPVEIVAVILPLLVASVVAFLSGGLPAAAGIIAAVLVGTVMFPLLLPWLPTRDFSTKGFVVGTVTALPFAWAGLLSNQGAAWWMQVMIALSYLLTLPTVSAFLALNFTGSTTFTSKSGVRREIFAYTPAMAGAAAIGILSAVAFRAIQIVGGS